MTRGDRLLNSIATEAAEQALVADLERARVQAVFLMANCPNPECPIGCPDSHADLGFPEVNCGTFLPPEIRPLGGAHPDAWRCLFPPQVQRLYIVEGVAILAPDPDSAWRMLAEALAPVC